VAMADDGDGPRCLQVAVHLGAPRLVRS
jgi:hypothetical protein